MDAGPVLYLSRGPGPLLPQAGPGKVRERRSQSFSQPASQSVSQSASQPGRLWQRDAWCWSGCMYGRCRYLYSMLLTFMLPYGVTVVRRAGS